MNTQTGPNRVRRVAKEESQVIKHLAKINPNGKLKLPHTTKTIEKPKQKAREAKRKEKGLESFTDEQIKHGDYYL